MNPQGKAVVTVLGRDGKGIIARTSGVLYAHDVNILDLQQTVLSDLFNMVMLVDITSPHLDFGKLSEELTALGTELGLQIRIQRSEIFDAMHRI